MFRLPTFSTTLLPQNVAICVCKDYSKSNVGRFLRHSVVILIHFCLLRTQIKYWRTFPSGYAQVKYALLIPHSCCLWTKSSDSWRLFPCKDQKVRNLQCWGFRPEGWCKTSIGAQEELMNRVNIRFCYTHGYSIYFATLWRMWHKLTSLVLDCFVTEMFPINKDNQQPKMLLTFCVHCKGQLKSDKNSTWNFVFAVL